MGCRVYMTLQFEIGLGYLNWKYYVWNNILPLLGLYCPGYCGGKQLKYWSGFAWFLIVKYDLMSDNRLKRFWRIFIDYLPFVFISIIVSEI